MVYLDHASVINSMLFCYGVRQKKVMDGDVTADVESLKPWYSVEFLNHIFLGCCYGQYDRRSTNPKEMDTAVEQMEATRVARWGKVQRYVQTFIESRLPGFNKRRYKIINRGVLEKGPSGQRLTQFRRMVRFVCYYVQPSGTVPSGACARDCFCGGFQEAEDTSV